MGLSPLQLLNYFFEEVSVKTNPDYKESLDGILQGFNVTFESGENKNDPLLRRFILKIEQKRKPELPYELKIGMIGIFRIDEGFAARKKPDELEVLLNANCPSMLYSAARETILTLTGRCPHQPYLLPSISFANFQADNKRKSPPRPKAKK